MMQPTVINVTTKREQGRKAQLGNINAAKSVADIIRTTLGPRAMLKMLLDPMGGIVLTMDGNAILREIDVSHPAAKSMIELSRTQDEEVGDGTTSVIVLAGEMLTQAEPFLKTLHPRTIVYAYIQALTDALAILEELASPVDITNRQELMRIVQSTIGTKFSSRFGDYISQMAVDAVLTISTQSANPEQKRKEIDIKRYIKVEKVEGGMLEDSKVLDGLMFQKDIVHAKMKRRIVAPRILLLDCGLEYKKGESQTNVEIAADEDWEAILMEEERYIKKMCDEIIAAKPTLVITEKGCADMAQHFLAKAGISVIRRLRKTENNRIARATGAVICNETSMITEDDIGKGCGLFEIKKIGDEYYTFLVGCKNPKACTVVLRGASKDVLMEFERNLADAMCVVRNIVLDDRRLPGGGATEMAIQRRLLSKSKQMKGVKKWPYKAAAEAFEVIPRTLIDNCGASAIRVLTALRSKQADGKHDSWGVNGTTGEIQDMAELEVWDCYAVKEQTIKTAIESACMLLRIDDIVSGITHKD